jgi:dTDP-4-dehydrorhamnose 3,5-epimerase
MQLTETKLKGSFIIDLEERTDHRGFFARTFCAKEFAAHGLKPTVAQCNLSFNYKKGTLRGMHYQIAPATETKLIRCTQGAIYDVIIDIRPESPTYLSHIGVELTAENRRALYVPEMFAHGYQALTDRAEVVYEVSEFYTPGYERGLRYNDPAFDIEWPLPVSEISQKDAAWPLFEFESVLVGAKS